MDSPQRKVRSVLEEHSLRRRVNGAQSIFLDGEVGRSDRVVSAIYFHLSAHQWAARADDPAYLRALEEGLEVCRAPLRVLDIGTGAGASAHAVACRHPHAQVIAIDTSRRMLHQARRRFTRENLSYERASASRLPYAPASFDLIMWLNAIADPVELRRVSTDDAELLCVSHFVAPSPLPSVWTYRWRDLGFERRGCGRVADGGWELFRRVGARGQDHPVSRVAGRTPGQGSA